MNPDDSKNIAVEQSGLNVLSKYNIPYLRININTR
jgi:hypothetical protein